MLDGLGFADPVDVDDEFEVLRILSGSIDIVVHAFGGDGWTAHIVFSGNLLLCPLDLLVSRPTRP